MPATTNQTAARIMDVRDGIDYFAAPELGKAADLLAQAAVLVRRGTFRADVERALDLLGYEPAKGERPEAGEFLWLSSDEYLSLRVKVRPSGFDIAAAVLAPHLEGYTCDDEQAEGVDWTDAPFSAYGTVALS